MDAALEKLVEGLKALNGIKGVRVVEQSYYRVFLSAEEWSDELDEKVSELEMETCTDFPELDFELEYDEEPE